MDWHGTGKEQGFTNQERENEPIKDSGIRKGNGNQATEKKGEPAVIEGYGNYLPLKNGGIISLFRIRKL
jgi:hypothetical protein